jgi:hypothetical protein
MKSPNKKISLNNSSKRPRQHRKCFKVKLDKTSSNNFSDIKNDPKNLKERKKAILITWKRQI